MKKSIKMLSLWQPWASFCIWKHPVDGKAEKQVETRHWETSYRGILAIQATKTLVPEGKFEIETNKVFQSALMRHGFLNFSSIGKGSLVFGAILGVVELTEIRPIESVNTMWVDKEFSKWEKHFGIYTAGRFAWILRNPVEFKNPIYCRGLQSLGTPKPEIQSQIFEQL